MKIFSELTKRGLIKQTTNAEWLENSLDNECVSFYIGFDPTADSLHVGHLLQLILAKRLINAGHQAIMLIGGATASVGDPTGKTDMRKMLSRHEIEDNATAFTKQIKSIVGENCIVVNNKLWFQETNFLDFIREFGPHFSVNNMLRADCFKSRMENGLSFLEFNYMIMQAFDFLHLNTSLGCTVQIGGDDQWSNILAGIDLVRRKTSKESFGFTLPLLLTSDGKKMGKTENGAVWLNKDKTSVFDFFQFWRNVEDQNVIPLLKLMTLSPLSDIEDIEKNINNVGDINDAKILLALLVTSLVHGEDEASKAMKQAFSLFQKKDFSEMAVEEIADQTNIVDLLLLAGFAKSKTDARNLIDGKGVSVNDITITEHTFQINKTEFVKEIFLKKGKKNVKKFRIT